MIENIYDFKLKNCFFYRLQHIQYTSMRHLGEHVKLAELNTQQLFVKSYGQHTYLEAMKSSQPEFYANNIFSWI